VEIRESGQPLENEGGFGDFAEGSHFGIVRALVAGGKKMKVPINDARSWSGIKFVVRSELKQ
jgi:hypothetical protein